VKYALLAAAILWSQPTQALKPLYLPEFITIEEHSCPAFDIPLVRLTTDDIEKHIKGELQ